MLSGSKWKGEKLEFMREGLSSFWCQVRASSFLKVTKHQGMWSEGERERKEKPFPGLVLLTL